MKTMQSYGSAAIVGLIGLLCQAFPFSELIISINFFPCVSKITIITFNWVSIKDCRVLMISLINHTSILRDAEVICMKCH